MYKFNANNPIHLRLTVDYVGLIKETKATNGPAVYRGILIEYDGAKYFAPNINTHKAMASIYLYYKVTGRSGFKLVK